MFVILIYIRVCLYVTSVRFYDLGASLSGTSAQWKLCLCMFTKMNAFVAYVQDVGIYS